MRDYVVQLRKKLEPRFLNIVAGDVNAAQQPFLMWKNVQYATHRHDVRSGAAAGRGRADGHRRIDGAGAGRRQATSARDARGSIANAPGDPDLAVPAGQRARYEAAFARFCRVFPDMFYMEERGRNYFDTTKDRGRYLSAGFHNLMGYFRDDQPLYELILDEQQQASWTSCGGSWTSSPSATCRTYVAVHREPDDSRRWDAAAFGCRRTRIRSRSPPKPRIRGDRSRVPGRLPRAAKRRRSRPSEEYFDWINDRHPLGREGPASTPSRATWRRCWTSPARAYRRPLTQAERDDLRGVLPRAARRTGWTTKTRDARVARQRADVARLLLPHRPGRERRRRRRASVRCRITRWPAG